MMKQANPKKKSPHRRLNQLKDTDDEKEQDYMHYHNSASTKSSSVGNSVDDDNHENIHQVRGNLVATVGTERIHPYLHEAVIQFLSLGFYLLIQVFPVQVFHILEERNGGIEIQHYLVIEFRFLCF